MLRIPSDFCGLTSDLWLEVATVKNKLSFCVGLALTIVLLVGARVKAQSPSNKLEVGTQVTSFTLFGPDGYGAATEMGFGGRITYNINRKIAVEAESNFFPHRNIFQSLGEGRALQAQFGLKAGKRFQKFGVFGKVRPGFLSVGDVFSYEPGASLFIFGVTIPNGRISRKTHFTTDVGGVFELYPSKRTVVRFDAGDTIVRYGRYYDYTALSYPQLVTLPARIKHNFQFSTGVSVRLGHAGPTQPPHSVGGHARDKAARFEVGIQFTSLSVNHPIAPCSDICLSGGPPRSVPEPGLGGRFTFNLKDSVALEAETNFSARDYLGSFEGGRIFQSQFGVKAGKRFRKFGVFGKARPGFVGFTKVNQLVGTHTQMIFGQQRIIGDFRVGAKKYFSTDIGGVLEFYVSRRVLTRMDLGDTIIHYSERDAAGLSLSRLIVRVPPETRHNLQFSAGVGFRF
jgi:hypothetical protein